MIVVIQFDTLDYLNEQISIPSSTIIGQTIQNADDAQVGNDITNVSSSRTSIKKTRIRISMWLNDLFGLHITGATHPHPLANQANTPLWRSCTLCTLFCTFRL